MLRIFKTTKINSFKAYFGLLSAVFLLGSCNNDDDGSAPPMQEDKNIVETAIDAEYNTLAAALVEAGLDDDLQAAGPFTVFAPTDAAFAAIGITPANVGDVENLS